MRGCKAESEVIMGVPLQVFKRSNRFRNRPCVPPGP